MTLQELCDQYGHEWVIWRGAQPDGTLGHYYATRATIPSERLPAGAALTVHGSSLDALARSLARQDELIPRAET